MTPIATYRVRVDTPSGRKSYMLEARTPKDARKDIQDYLDQEGMTGEIVDVRKAGEG